jgi:hypothetical protein
MWIGEKMFVVLLKITATCMTAPLSVAPFVKHGSPVLGVRRLKYVTHCRPSNSELSSAMVKLMPSHHPAKILNRIKNKNIRNHTVHVSLPAL